MNKTEIYKAIRAMETIARCVNDESVFEGWLINGVADGDIGADTPDEDLEWYTEDEHFRDLMTYFLYLMYRARKSGGLYCDDVVSAD